MKHCPECNFTFPDFHRVCDFDGTVLAADADRPSVYEPPRTSRVRRVLKSPKFLTSIAVLALFGVSVAIGYLVWPAQSIPRVRLQMPPDSARVNDVARPDQPNVQIRTRASATGEGIAPNRLARRSGLSRRQADALLRHRRVIDNQEPESAGRRDEQLKDNDSDPKLVAVLKTTWRVLKKPFRF